jgi:Haem-binding domain
MRRRLKQGGFVLVVLFAAAQLVRPERANPTTDPTRTIHAHLGTTSGVVGVLDRSCRDCHSNGTVWPWYTEIAPLSWLILQGGPFALLRPETRLSAQDVETICAAARQYEASAANGRGER